MKRTKSCDDIDNEKDHLNSNGFCVSKSVIPIQSITSLRTELADIFSHLRRSQQGQTQQQFWQGFSSQAIRTLRFPNIEILLEGNKHFEVVKSQIDKLLHQNFEQAVAFQHAHSFFKPAKIGIETPWHQDPAYGDTNSVYDNITCWIPLKDINSEKDSCLEFIPKSHKTKAVRTHFPISRDCLSALEAKVSLSELDCAVPALCKIGDVVLHRSYVLHRGTYNFSKNDRIAIVLIYAPLVQDV